jgi:hypothetical protein
VWQEYHGQKGTKAIQQLEESGIDVDTPLSMDHYGHFTDRTEKKGPKKDGVLTLKDGMSMDGKMNFRYSNDDYSYIAVQYKKKSTDQFKWVSTEWPPKQVPTCPPPNDSSPTSPGKLSPTSPAKLPVEVYFQSLISSRSFLDSGDGDAVRKLALESCEAKPKPTQHEIEENPFLQGPDTLSCKRFEAPAVSEDAELDSQQPELSSSTSLHTCDYGLHSIAVAVAVLLSQLASW